MTQVLVSIGSNIDPRKHIQAALAALQDTFGELTCSSIYETQAVGFAGPAFHNLAVRFATDQSAEDVNATLKRIEQTLGRPSEGPKFGDRCIDLDLILYGQQQCESETLCLPRAELTEQAFVLGPATEIAGEWVHPVNGQSLASLWVAMGETLKPSESAPC